MTTVATNDDVLSLEIISCVIKLVTFVYVFMFVFFPHYQHIALL